MWLQFRLWIVYNWLNYNPNEINSNSNEINTQTDACVRDEGEWVRFNDNWTCSASHFGENLLVLTSYYWNLLNKKWGLWNNVGSGRVKVFPIILEQIKCSQSGSVSDDSRRDSVSNDSRRDKVFPMFLEETKCSRYFSIKLFPMILDQTKCSQWFSRRQCSRWFSWRQSVPNDSPSKFFGWFSIRQSLSDVLEETKFSIRQSVPDDSRGDKVFRIILNQTKCSQWFSKRQCSRWFSIRESVPNDSREAKCSQWFSIRRASYLIPQRNTHCPHLGQLMYEISISILWVSIFSLVLMKQPWIFVHDDW